MQAGIDNNEEASDRQCQRVISAEVCKSWFPAYDMDDHIEGLGS
jgi:hypothetical protein